MTTIASFKVQNQRGLINASCETVPSLMIIAGPNGAGKSTLLNALRSQGNGGKVVYISPHRGFRRQTVQHRSLLANDLNLEDILATSSLPGVEGIRLLDSSRDAWSADDSGNYLKFSMCQIEVRRKEAIAQRYDQKKSIAENEISDPWQPLKSLLQQLLPHLEFESIDNANRDQMKCVFKAHKKTSVDIDELSSGEKAILHMFFPLLEYKINALLEEIKGNKKDIAGRKVCILIDEPELHLHPILQVKILDYLRLLTTDSTSGSTQVILATHSNTMLEYATNEELYLLRPAELIQTGENQLIQIADDEQKLNALRAIFGQTANLTALQPIVVIEGTEQEKNSGVISDRKMFRALCDKFDSVITIPGGGKEEAKKLRLALEKCLSQFSKNLKVVALLDKDTGESKSTDQNVFFLPVSTIENFLVDPVWLWESLQSVIEKTEFKSIDDLEKGLMAVLDSLTSAEIDRRIKQQLGGLRFYPHDPIGEIEKQIAEFKVTIESRFSKEKISKLQDENSAAVDKLSAENSRREQFSGKEILNLFFKKHIHATGMSKIVFLFETARRSKARKSVSQFFEDFFRTIQ